MPTGHWNKKLSAYKSGSSNVSRWRRHGRRPRICFPGGAAEGLLFNPLMEAGIEEVVANLAQSLRQYPRAVYLLYRNPSFEHVVARYSELRKIAGTPQYSIFRN